MHEKITKTHESLHEKFTCGKRVKHNTVCERSKNQKGGHEQETDVADNGNWKV